ncbi:hypothetical protein VP01_3747g3 [Puccinia sorghi]|uniref:Uncharacterized protein n=1 Tax=Puccinia sorghi TaxID=27349 RepID=A0A0L6UTV6_9BASI|nr:hypothetical protein VP01_3747g3 [Puccinia sorghi]
MTVSLDWIFLNENETILNCLKATNRKFTLIHYVWKTKGCGKQKETTLVSLVHQSFSQFVFLTPQRKNANKTDPNPTCLHIGSFLEEPIVNVLVTQGLQRKININSMLSTKKKNLSDFFQQQHHGYKNASEPLNNGRIRAFLRLTWKIKTPPPNLKKAFIWSFTNSNTLKPLAEKDEDVGEEVMDDDDDTGYNKETDGNYSNICTSQKSSKKKTSARNRNKSCMN